jgi:hypothetical protein
VGFEQINFIIGPKNFNFIHNLSLRVTAVKYVQI